MSPVHLISLALGLMSGIVASDLAGLSGVTDLAIRMIASIGTSLGVYLALDAAMTANRQDIRNHAELELRIKKPGEGAALAPELQPEAIVNPSPTYFQDLVRASYHESSARVR